MSIAEDEYIARQEIVDAARAWVKGDQENPPDDERFDCAIREAGQKCTACDLIDAVKAYERNFIK